MTTPYHVTMAVLTTPTDDQSRWEIHLELVDTRNISAQRETLTIRTQIDAPLSNPSLGLELAALLHVRDLLDAQIQAMQSA
jgi:hypothetical protein